MWKDASTYSRDDPERVPYAWEAKIAGERAVLVRGHRYNPDKFVISFGPWFVLKEVGRSDMDVKAAQITAAVMIQRVLQRASKDVSKLVDPKTEKAPQWSLKRRPGKSGRAN